MVQLFWFADCFFHAQWIIFLYIVLPHFSVCVDCLCIYHQYYFEHGVCHFARLYLLAKHWYWHQCIYYFYHSPTDVNNPISFNSTANVARSFVVKRFRFNLFCDRGHSKMVGISSQAAMISVIYELRQCAIALATDWVHGRVQITQSCTYTKQLEQSLWFCLLVRFLNKNSCRFSLFWYFLDWNVFLLECLIDIGILLSILASFWFIPIELSYYLLWIFWQVLISTSITSLYSTFELDLPNRKRDFEQHGMSSSLYCSKSSFLYFGHALCNTLVILQCENDWYSNSMLCLFIGWTTIVFQV